MRTTSKVVTIDVPEYRLANTPDYMAVGSRVDSQIASSFGDGEYVVRSVGSSDHPGKSIDDLANIILGLGTDKYDSNRREVAHPAFQGYDHDFQASFVEISNGQVVVNDDAVYPTMFGDIMYHFYELTQLDRGYPVRIDLLIIYYADQLDRARHVSTDFLSVPARLETYLYKFRHPSRKVRALAGLVKIRAE